MRKLLLTLSALFLLAGSLGRGRKSSFLHARLVRLRRLGPLPVHGEIRPAEEMGGQVRRRHQSAALRLRAVAGRFRRQEHRRLRDDQHGGARHAGGRRRRHHVHHRRRLFQRQRRGAGAPQSHARPDPRQARAAGGKNRFAISVRARHGDQQSRGRTEAREIREHLGFRHRRRVLERHQPGRGGHLEAAGLADPQRQRDHQDFRFVEDPRRNSGPDGGANRSAQPAGRLRAALRQSDRGRLVRTDGPDGQAGSGRRQGAFVHRRSFRRHAGFLQRTARHHASVLHRALGRWR